MLKLRKCTVRATFSHSNPSIARSTKTSTLRNSVSTATARMPNSTTDKTASRPPATKKCTPHHLFETAIMTVLLTSVKGLSLEIVPQRATAQTTALLPIVKVQMTSARIAGRQEVLEITTVASLNAKMATRGVLTLKINRTRFPNHQKTPIDFKQKCKIITMGQWTKAPKARVTTGILKTETFLGILASFQAGKATSITMR